MFAVGFLGTVCLAAPPSGREKGSQAASRRIQDPHVVSAGGARCSCRSGACSCDDRTTGHNGHHPDCRDGRCAPYCPVRPQHYGYYGTEWRRWTGQGVVAVSDERAATPALPPRMAVPGPDQESMQPSVNEDLQPGDDRPAAAAPESSFPEPLTPAPAPRSPRAAAPAEPEAFVPPPAPEPAASVPLPEDENLFNSGIRQKARRKFAVGAGEGMQRNEDGGVRAATHTTPVVPKPVLVPPVAFDRAAEARLLREIR